MRNLSLANKQHQGRLLVLPFRLLGLHWMVVMVLVLGLCLGLGIVGHGQTATTTSVVVKAGSNNPSTYGEEVTFTVTINESGSPIQTPSGTVSLFDNNNFVDSQDLLPLPDTSAAVDFDICFLSVGEHEIRAEYSGATGAGYDYDLSSGSLTQTVNKISPTSFAISDVKDYEGNTGTTSVFVGEPYTVTGLIAPSSVLTDCGGTVKPTGTVTVSDGEGKTCAANLESNGSWECTMSSDSQNVIQLTATYEGDEIFTFITGTYNLTVGPRETEVLITGPVSACVGQEVELVAHVSDTSGIPGSPPFVGDVTWNDGAAHGSFSPTTPCTVNASGTCSVIYTPHADDEGTSVTISAIYAFVDTTDPNYTTSPTATHPLTVTPRSVLIDITCQPATVYINETADITVTVTDVGCGASVTPTGALELTLVAQGGQAGTPVQPTGSSTSTGAIEFTGGRYTPTANDNADDESHVIKATFTGDGDFDGITATGTFPLDVNKRETQVAVTCSPESVFIGETTQVTATITDVTPSGHGTSDFANDDPSPTVVFDDLGRNGTFTSITKTGHTSGQIVYEADYTPAAGDAGTVTIHADYAGSNVYKAAFGEESVTVETRPTTTLVICAPAAVFVDERTAVTITVADVGPAGSLSTPSGVLYLSTTGNGAFYDSIGTLITSYTFSGGMAIVYYEAETAAAAVDTHVLKADYVGTGLSADATTQVHEDSSGSTSLTINLRKTTLWISPGAELLYSTGTMSSGITATVTDVTIQGESSSPGGVLTLEAPSGGGATAGTIFVSSTTPAGATIVGNNTSKVKITWSTFVAGGTTVIAGATYNLVEKLQLVHPIIGTFVPNDKKHLGIAYITNDDDGTVIKVKIDETNYPVGPPPGGTESDGTGEVISCGLIGGTTVDELFKFGTMHQTYIDLMKFMDIAATIIQLFPDVIIDVTDPAWSLIHVAFQGLVLDLDGDGILGVYELAYVWDITAAGGPLTDFTPDSDGDGIWDGTEIALAGGNYYPTILDTTYSWSRPNPTHCDSDRDGISDGDEYYTFLTNCCDPDTDDDGLLDGEELATWAAFTATGYESTTLPSTSPRTDIRDQSDPFVQDTDSDGLRDDIEFAEGCPYVNDDDSDDDGLQDGYEDANQSGTIINTIGGSASHGSGETDFCNPDTDGDGLSDGEEEGLLGVGPTSAVTPSGVVSTVPALDTDSDDDYLTDYEEVNVYNTNPMDADSDGDGVADSVEVATWDSTIHTRLQAAYTAVEFTASTLYLGYFALIEGSGASGDSRDHADPNADDTDGDGLTDDLEIAYGCTYVNDDDSDDDGLQDGYEIGSDGVWEVTEYGSSTGNGVGETDACNEDTDNDGLLDGEEEGLFGHGSVAVIGDVWTSSTVPALDVDCDRDGLSDYEEVHVTMTNPLHWDTDGDGLSDAEELIVTGGGPFPVFSATTNTDGVARTFYQESDPLDPDTDDDGLSDFTEYGPNGSGVDETSTATVNSGTPDTDCPYVNDDDSDDDGLQDGVEDWDRDGVKDFPDPISIGLGRTGTQADIAWETDPCDEDTDNDGLTDGEECALLGGLKETPAGWHDTGPSYVTSFEYVTAVVDTAGTTVETIPALDDDCDNDGLSDYEEVNVTGTDPLDADTDDDGLLDSWELIVTSGNFPNRTFYQESDPLDPDTDDDGIRDDVEYNDGAGSGVGRDSTSGIPDTTCTYVNDDDSDDDGLQDGVEDWDRDGVKDFPATLGQTGTQANIAWETDPCDEDTDNDGLSDGEECGLLGGLLDQPTVWHDSSPYVTSFEYVTAVNPAGTPVYTIPALDDDCDDDGLSDYEEVNITGTDPLDADTDDDGLLDSWELIVTSGDFPNRSFYQESDPLDPDTDDDGIRDDVEYNDKLGSGVGRNYGDTSGLYGDRDNECPYVNDDDSDDDGLQDGTEDANHDGTWGVGGSGITLGQMNDGSQALRTVDYWETDLCNPDTDGDGLLDGEEVSLIGGEPIMPAGGFDPQDPLTRPAPGFYIVYPEGRSMDYPDGPNYTGGTNPLPLYTFTPMPGGSIDPTIPALDVDSDNDGLSDYEEVNITGTDPLDADSDNDTIMDADELIATGGLEDTPWIPGNPYTPGIGPRRTFDQESDPLDINTDDDYLFDPVEGLCADPIYVGTGLSALKGKTGGVRDTDCPYVNNADSDDDGLKDGLVVYVDPQTSLGYDYSYTHFEDFRDVTAYLGPDGLNLPGYAKVTVTPPTDGEQYNDEICNVCDADSDGDGLLDGEEVSIGTNPDDWDTDNDGRSDWHEHTGGGPIPTDPFDPDTDDDGLTDSVEVFGDNPTNPVNADTDGDGLCDGGTGTPWMTSLDSRVIVNPICKSCAIPGLGDCGTGSVRTGSVDGIGDHPNPHGYGEDKDGDGTWDGSIGDEWDDGEPGSPETDPNQYDTDGDAEGDGIEVLGFSTSRQYMIPPDDIFGRPITVDYPACGCLEPLILDTDGDGLTDGYEDNNHDGNFDFLPSDFDYAPDPLPGPPQPNPNETNPCDPDTDHDELTDWEERNQRQPLLSYPALPLDNDGDGLIDEDPVDGIDNDLDGLIDEDPPEGPIELTFNPTNPLDHDTDNDRLLDGFEVKYVCVAVTYSQLDNDGDALIDEDPVDGLDNDGDGLFDEDPVDFFVRFVPMLDPTCRDSDSDGWIDGLDDDPCNSELIPLLQPVQMQPIDTDGDGFADDDEIMAGTHPNDPEDYPIAYYKLDLDFDQAIDDRMWLEKRIGSGIANSVVIDIDCNVLIDARVQIVAPRDVKQGDFDGDGAEDDYRYVVEYAFSNYRVVQPRIVLTIDDYNGDLVIDHAEVVKK